MRGLALLVILWVNFDGNPHAFSPHHWNRVSSALRRTSLAVRFQQGRQRDYYETKKNSRKKQQQERRKDSFHRKRRNRRASSPEFERALKAVSLQTDPADITARCSTLVPREQVHLIEELERSDRYQVILQLLQSESAIPQRAWEAALVALCRSPKYRSQALDMLFDQEDTRQQRKQQQRTLSSYTCKALFQTVSNASEAATLMEQLQSHLHDKTTLNTVDVWNAALYACRQSSPHDNQNDNWQTAVSMLREMKRRHGVTPNQVSFGHALTACAQAGQSRIALVLLKELQQSSPHTTTSPQIWGALLHACAKTSSSGLDDALAILGYMQQHHIDINTIHVSAFLSTCAKAARDDIAVQVLESFRQHQEYSLSSHNVTLAPVEIDLVVINTVLQACAKANNFTAAMNILQQVKQGEYEHVEAPDVISYNTVLSACNDAIQAKALVKEMRLSRRYRYGAVPPNSITYTHAISACRSDVESVRFLLDLARNDGLEPNVYMYSAAIWSCGDDADAALDILEQMQMADNNCAPNVVSYNGVISSLAIQGRAEEALSLFEEMKDANVKPNRITFQKLATAIRSSTEDIAKSEMLEHILSLMNPNEMRANVGGLPILEALIRQYGAGGKYAEARRVFELIKGPVDARCLRAIIYACSVGEPPRWEDALSLLHTSDIVEGTRGPAKVDSKALSYAMLACAKADQWQEALNLAELYGRSYSTDRKPRKTVKDNDAVTLPAFNALMAACGRCGQPGVALRLLNDMEPVFGVAPDERSFRTAVIACNQAEHNKRRRQRRGLMASDDDKEEFLQWWECSLSLLRRMKESKLRVDPQTYSSVISACEAAGQWQRALGVLHSMMKTKGRTSDDYSRLNLFCFNAAISACEKGGAWVEALELYYRMKDKGGNVAPNFVTLSSILVALDKAGQKELAQSTYEEGVRDGVVTPWKMTRARDGGQLRAMDLHRFSAAMANAAVRSVMESLLSSEPVHDVNEELVIIVGKGKGSEDKPVLLSAVRTLLEKDYGIVGEVDATNAGRFVVAAESLQVFAETRQWQE